MTADLNFDIFKGLSAFAELNIQKDGNLSGERCALELISRTENSLTFGEKTLGIDFTVTLSTCNNSKVLRYKANFTPRNLGDIRDRNHFAIKCAVGLHIGGIENFKKYFATYRKCDFWVHPAFGTKLSSLPKNTQTVLFDTGENYGCFTTVCDKIFKSSVEGCEDGGFELFIKSNDYRNCADTVALVYSFGDDIYELPKTVISDAFISMGKKPLMREERKYPNALEYLGWCSWDAFHMDVTHNDLVNKAKEFKEKGIPVRWMLLDDMWGDVPNNNIPTMHSRELDSFEAPLDRFPKGLKGIVSELKNDYDMLVGLWHPTTGYWHGINPTSKLAKEYKDLLFYSLDKVLIHSYDREKIKEYYDRQHNFYKSCGVDFIKVDYQSSIDYYGKLVTSYGEAADNLHNAIEYVADKYYDGQLINCMGQASENFWHRDHSAVCRFSGDFQPENRKWFATHIMQCSFNSMMQGTVYTGDWDMWWSDDGQAVRNSVLRAMSGGPIYISDKLGRSIKETIMPTVLSDGRILRLKNPAYPSNDCLFDNPKESGGLFKVFNTHNDCGILSVFNIDTAERCVSGRVSACDMRLDTKKDYCVYDWFAKKTFKLSANDSFELSLTDYDDFRLYLFVPIENGKAVIGLCDKYMSVASFDKKGDIYTFADDGTVCVYSETGVTVNGEVLKSTGDGSTYVFIAKKDEQYELY